MLQDTSDYIRQAMRTHVHLESSAVDSSNNWSPALDYTELDHIKVDPSVMHPERDFNVNRPDTHLHVDIADVSAMFPEKGTSYYDSLLDDLIDRLGHDDPYYKEREIIAKMMKD